jgi:Inner membrane component domain
MPLWLLLADRWLVLRHLITGVLMCITIVGIPLELAKPIRSGVTASGGQRPLDCPLAVPTGEREHLPVDRGEETVVFVRVVRFTDVTAERVESLVGRIDETGPPPGVPIKNLQLVFDEAQGTAVVLQYFETEEDLRSGAETFAAMDASETPGSRVSVDTGELKVDRGL